jgi:hypothetical protein
MGQRCSLFSLYFHRNAWANLHLLGQPDTFLALAQAVRELTAKPAALYGLPDRGVRRRPDPRG